MAQGMKLAFKWQPGYEAMSTSDGTSAHGKKTSSQNHRHDQDTGELSLEEWDKLFIRPRSTKSCQYGKLALVIPQ